MKRRKCSCLSLLLDKKTKEFKFYLIIFILFFTCSTLKSLNACPVSKSGLLEYGSDWFNFYVNTSSFSGYLDSTAALNSILQARGNWWFNTNMDKVLTYVGTTTETPQPNQQSGATRNVIWAKGDECHPNGCSIPASTTGTNYNSSTGKWERWVMVLWKLSTVSVTTDYPNSSQADFQAIIAHEIGHVFGFPHISTSYDSIMWANAYAGYGWARYPTDVDATCAKEFWGLRSLTMVRKYTSNIGGTNQGWSSAGSITTSYTAYNSIGAEYAAFPGGSKWAVAWSGYSLTGSRIFTMLATPGSAFDTSTKRDLFFSRLRPILAYNDYNNYLYAYGAKSDGTIASQRSTDGLSWSSETTLTACLPGETPPSCTSSSDNIKTNLPFDVAYDPRTNYMIVALLEYSKTNTTNDQSINLYAFDNYTYKFRTRLTTKGWGGVSVMCGPTSLTNNCEIQLIESAAVSPNYFETQHIPFRVNSSSFSAGSLYAETETSSSAPSGTFGGSDKKVFSFRDTSSTYNENTMIIDQSQWYYDSPYIHSENNPKTAPTIAGRSGYSYYMLFWAY